MKAYNGLICIDRNECEEKTALCEQDCQNTYGGYTCSCKKGYQLAANGETCDGENGFFLLEHIKVFGLKGNFTCPISIISVFQSFFCIFRHQRMSNKWTNVLQSKMFEHNWFIRLHV